MRFPRRWAASLILAPSLLAGCSRAPAPAHVEVPTEATQPAGPLRVAVASDLQAVLPAILAKFAASEKFEAVPTFGASGQLARQIEEGAPFDVFLSANRPYVEELARKGLIRPDSDHPYAIGSLALVVRRDPATAIEKPADLAKAEVKKVALANPEFAPYGAAGKQWLERAGLWEAVGPKVVRTESVRQALQLVQSGNAEAGLVGRAIADVPEVRIVEVDPAGYDPIVQALGVVAATKQGGRAEAFCKFLLGPEGQGMLLAAGFRPATPAVAPR